MLCGPRRRTRYPRDPYGGVVQVAGEGAGPAASGSSLGTCSAWRSAIFSCNACRWSWTLHWGIPAAVTCWALGFSKQAFHASKNNPVSQWDWDEPHLTKPGVGR
jgi:hypothetical protein